MNYNVEKNIIDNLLILDKRPKWMQNNSEKIGRKNPDFMMKFFERVLIFKCFIFIKFSVI